MNKSQWQIRPGFVAGLVLLFALALIVLPNLASTGRLYGNNLMRVECHWQIEALRNAETNNLNFDFFKLSDDKKRGIILHGWNSGFWIKTNFIWEASESNPQIIIICGREFDNVPKP
ncbi:MAG: hypothetical protein ABSE90_05670, partial [Verrucomicrobiota bacterium]